MPLTSLEIVAMMNNSGGCDFTFCLEMTTKHDVDNKKDVFWLQFLVLKMTMKNKRKVFNLFLFV